MQSEEINAHNFHINNILKKLEEKELDAMLVANFNNIYYLSGYLSTSFAFLILKENPIIFVSGMDMENASNTSSIDIVKFESYKQMIEYLKEEEIKNLAIESDLTANVYEKFNDFKLTISDVIARERMIKTDDEIEKILKATDIAHKSLLELDVRDKQEKGALEWECAYELGYLMRKNGASSLAFETIAVSGDASALPHGTPRNVKLKSGFLTMDYGAKYDGYCSDMTRTIVIGKANEEIKKLYNTVLNAQLSAIEYLKAGCDAGQADKIARDIIDAVPEYKGAFGHSLGHAVGLFIHESPRVSFKSFGEQLQVGNVVTVEPGIYLFGKYGCRIEDMVAIEENGVRNFTHSTKELIEIL
jgi:Xaa-Pro dipeptidase